MNAALQALWDEAQGEAKEEMREESNAKLVNNVKSLMENLKCDFDRAAQLLTLSDEDKAMIAKALNCKKS